MTDDLSAVECRLLVDLYGRTIPTAQLSGPVLAGLIARGLVEVTWARRARLTAEGAGLFEEKLVPPPTYIGYCCREWVLAVGYPAGRCGLCGERPEYLREDSGDSA